MTDSNRSRRERFRRILPWAVWLVILGFLCARGLRRGPTFDFGVFYDAACSIGEGGSLYEGPGGWEENYLYGPMFALCCRPLAWFDREAAFILWMLASAFAVLLAALASGAALRNASGRRTSQWILLGAVLVLILPMASNFRHANLNAFLMLLICAGYGALASGRPVTAGLSLSLAATFKVTPLLYLPWLLLRREWRGAAGFVIGLALWVLLAPILGFGFGKAMDETLRWGEKVLLPVVKSGAEEGPGILKGSGSSLPRAAMTLLAERTGEDPDEDKESTPPAVMNLKPEIAKAIGYGLGLAVILATLCLTRREEGFGAAGFGLVAAAMLLASPVSRSGHFVQLYPLVAFVLALAFQGEGSLRTSARITLCAGVLVMLLLLGAASAAGLSSKAFFYICGSTLAFWAGGFFLVNRPKWSIP